MKKILFTSLMVVAAVLWSPPPVQAGGVGAVDFGITNTSFSANSGSTNLGVSTASIDQNDNVLLVFTGTLVNTNADSVTTQVSRVDGDGNIETVPFLTWTIRPTSTTNTLAAGTNAFMACTNLTRDLIGGAYGLSVRNVTNNSTAGALTSPAFKVWKKRLQAPN